jgi:hypothetical protein
MHKSHRLSVGATCLVSILCLFSCAQSPRHRPRDVPPDTVWAGGIDGGHYFHCGVDQKKGVNPCTIWNEETGEIVVQDDFWVFGEDRAATAEELAFNYWDGERIGLQNITGEGRYLTLERAGGLRPLTVCEVLADLPKFDGTMVAVLGRLDTTDRGKSLLQKGCSDGGGANQVAQFQVVDNPRPPLPKIGPWHLDGKAVREKWAIVRRTTNLELVRPSPKATVFRCWEVVYGRLRVTVDSPPSILSSGDDIQPADVPESCFPWMK